MPPTSPGPLRQLVDWSAAFWAGVAAGVIFLGLNVYAAPAVIGGNGWSFIRLLAAPVMGDGVLAPPASFDAAIALVGLGVHLVLSVAFALLLAIVIHRWGLLVGMLGGALFGVALYGIVVYTASLLFPWLLTLQSPLLLATHVIFGIVAGGVYETLEVEEFAPSPAAAGGGNT
ncbi:MAG: hypothetical protein HKN62_10425 [Phycisphaerales bacterium]|nr:hypothetical protein [Phycisphaerales bacterium]